MKLRSLALITVVGLAFSGSMARGDWPTARGNAQRTGNVDGKAGPKSPKVLWVYESTDHYISTGSPGGNAFFVPALGTLNSGVMSAFSTDPAAAGPKRILWSKSQPFLKLPTVCAPAIVGGRAIFGDGMHQNSNPTLYCVDAAGGAAVWQLQLPGDLYHIEGTPTVGADGKAYFGGGSAGVICIDTNKVTLDGKETDAAAVARTIAARWKELQAKYEEDKKKDPDFAIPPSEDALPKPAPKVLWRQGAGDAGGGKTWHVDAPVALAGDRVLAASAYLDTEKTGDRAVYCLGANDGQVKWRAETKFNPWGGPSVSGDLVLVGCSSVRFDPDLLTGAQGEVMAIGLSDGQVKWRKDAGAGVLSPVACANGLAIFTTTDKKVVALDEKTGEQKWKYEARAPFFAGVAVAGDVVYAADLNGVVHAIDLADGRGRWRLDVGKQTKAPGRIYGSPVVDNGRLYVSTCNLDSTDAKKTLVVCIGEK
ncbi:MAG TPA: PQQ-binding-like beta-propeller repeat protein [Tepidisphaeraceae bacterium]